MRTGRQTRREQPETTVAAGAAAAVPVDGDGRTTAAQQDDAAAEAATTRRRATLGDVHRQSRRGRLLTGAAYVQFASFRSRPRNVSAPKISARGPLCKLTHPVQIFPHACQ